ncbi:MAG: hypothetical protein ACRDHG_04190, partial [Anaerolineales bacterium]
MVESAKPPTATQQFSRLSILAEDLRRLLDGFNATLSRAGAAVPANVLLGMNQISSTLDELKESVRSNEHERRNLQALAEVGQVVNSSLDLSHVLREVIDTLIRITGAGRAFLMLLDQNRDLEIGTARNWERESLNSEDQQVSRTIIDRVVERGEAVLT